MRQSLRLLWLAQETPPTRTTKPGAPGPQVVIGLDMPPTHGAPGLQLFSTPPTQHHRKNILCGKSIQKFSSFWLRDILGRMMLGRMTFDRPAPSPFFCLPRNITFPACQHHFPIVFTVAERNDWLLVIPSWSRSLIPVQHKDHYQYCRFLPLFERWKGLCCLVWS